MNNMSRAGPVSIPQGTINTGLTTITYNVIRVFPFRKVQLIQLAQLRL